MDYYTSNNSGGTPYVLRRKEDKLDREEYERDLAERKKRHLDAIENRHPWRPCLHDGCPECVGTGRRRDGSMCIHMISCPCPRCSPHC